MKAYILQSWRDPDSIKAGLKEKRYEDVDWFLVTQDRD
jgi:hypothetical protein